MGTHFETLELIFFAALVSLGTLLLLAGLFSVVFLPGSLLPAAVMAAGGVLLAAAVTTPIAHTWLEGVQRIRARASVGLPLERPEQVTRALERLRTYSRSQVADGVVSGTLNAVFLVGLLATGFFGFSNSAVGISQVEMRTDVAVSLIALGIGTLWGWLSPISRLARARQGTVPEAPGLVLAPAMIGPLGLNGAAPSPRPLWLLLSRAAGDIIGLVVGLMIGGALAFVAAYQLGVPSPYAAITVFVAAVLLLAVAIMTRVRTLRRLCTTGVEVEARLDDVSTTGSGDSRTYVAQYHYVFAGRSFPLQIRGIFRRSVTRFGERPIVLVDPEHPNSAVVFRES